MRDLNFVCFIQSEAFPQISVDIQDTTQNNIGRYHLIFRRFLDI